MNKYRRAMRHLLDLAQPNLFDRHHLTSLRTARMVVTDLVSMWVSWKRVLGTSLVQT